MKILIGLIIGFPVGYIFAAACEVIVEKGYIKAGIAKIYGKYYKLEEIEREVKK